ncbi:MAG: M20/M25/M40 family metallo-hydrolase [Actinophytocola sp.]|uniref:M20/M25/M40 family metallo-hydrolase n=1 Tax=Actinophytocola sp. TaxID=1872138 RepID=UPI0013215BF8|nr:M20/M25/M40 family metallo-hydrolase [Actinophytocola sp.]MPZ83939.1 M20/M25/M40 family metallo-hydrolase [Actinophytocola sp.]
MGRVDNALVRGTVERVWDDAVLTSLSEFVSIPALSPIFDEGWEASGHLDAAVEHVRRWLVARDIDGATAEILRLPGKSPVLLFDVPPTEGARADAGTALLYGHLDKQPPVGGWGDGLGPWTPVLRDGRLYGRGAADDGYSGYAATAAIEAVRAAGGPHARCVVLLETSEESGSPDLPDYLERYAGKLGEVSLVVCLDSGGQDYERLWLTTSLRGLVSTTVTVQVLASGQHSGMASGIVPSSFRIMRSLLDRLEDARTGEVLLSEMHGDVPPERLAEVKALADLAPGAAGKAFPLLEGMSPVSDDDVELMLNNSWRPTLSVIGGAGFPLPTEAGNVLRTETTFTLSFRLPPTADPKKALAALEKTLTTDVPYGAHVELSRSEDGPGWNAPATAPWLQSTLDSLGDRVFDGNPCLTIRLGGSIPFMGTLADHYPKAQFVVTGALSSDSNPHVPDEWLNIPHAKRVTEAVALILVAHARG